LRRYPGTEILAAAAEEPTSLTGGDQNAMPLRVTDKHNGVEHRGLRWAQEHSGVFEWDLPLWAIAGKWWLSARTRRGRELSGSQHGPGSLYLPVTTSLQND